MNSKKGILVEYGKKVARFRIIVVSQPVVGVCETLEFYIEHYAEDSMNQPSWRLMDRSDGVHSEVPEWAHNLLVHLYREGEKK